MNRTRKILLLLAVALALGAWAVRNVRHRRRDADRGMTERLGQALLPAMQDPAALASVARVTLTRREPEQRAIAGLPLPPEKWKRAAPQTVNVVQSGRRWTIRERYGYPANHDKFMRFARSIVQLKAGPTLPRTEKARETMGLISPFEEKSRDFASGLHIAFYDRDDRLIAELLAGDSVAPEMIDEEDRTPSKTEPRRSRYVLANNRIYLVSDVFAAAPRGPREWLEPKVINIAARDVMRIEVRHPDGESFTLERPTISSDLELTPGREGEQAHRSRIAGMAGVLTLLQLMDVADPALTSEETGLDRPVVYQADTRQGLRITVRIGGYVENGRHRYATLSVAAAELAPHHGELTRTDLDRAQATADYFNARYGRWTYVFHDFIVQNAAARRSWALHDPSGMAREESVTAPATEP
jgi:hypothetical protein